MCTVSERPLLSACSLLCLAVCPAGTYQTVTGSGASAVRSCQPCPTGSFCPGGDKNAKLPTDNYGGENKQCNKPDTDGLTTKSTKATKAADCGEWVRSG